MPPAHTGYLYCKYYFKFWDFCADHRLFGRYWLKKTGKKVYHLNIGQPDIETPSVFMEAINNYDTKVIKYSFSQGEPILINAIQKFFERDNIFFNENEILITADTIVLTGNLILALRRTTYI